MSPTFKIAVCHHKPGPYFRNEVFEPIQGGRALARLPLDGMAGDDTGTNVSEKNPFWSELTVLYWMRHNLSADYLGLLHYRRFLNFATPSLDQEYFLDCSDATIDRFGWTPDQVANFCVGYDVITSPIGPIYFSGRDVRLTPYEMYCDWHEKADIDKAIEIVSKKSPSLYPHLLKTLARKSCFWANTMVLRQNLFRDYADWLFEMMFALEKTIDVSGYSSYQQRVCGFISERLSNCYLDYLIATGARHRQAGVVFGVPDYRQPDPADSIRRIEAARKGPDKLRSSERIHIAFAADANSIPACGTAIASLLDNMHREQDISIHILHDAGLPPSHLDAISSLAADRDGARFCFYKIDAARFSSFPPDRPPGPTTAYFRLYLHEVLDPSVTKVICLDSDILVTDNIAKLWNIDLEGAIVGGCPDEGGLLYARRLRLPDAHPYFNAGVLVLDLWKLRTIEAEILYLETFVVNSAKILLGEQDILNIAFAGRTKRLPLRWNATDRLYDVNETDHLYSDEEARQAREYPGIVHFTDPRRPWTRKSGHPLRELYAMWRDTTPWAPTPAAKLGSRIYTGIRNAERGARHLRHAVLGKRSAKGAES